VAVIGVGDAEFGQRLRAIVVPTPGTVAYPGAVVIDVHAAGVAFPDVLMTAAGCIR